MSDAPRLVALDEHRRKSMIPVFVGSLNVFTALALLAGGGLIIGYLLLFQILSPRTQAAYKQSSQRIEKRIQELQDQQRAATSESEKKSLQRQIDEQRRSLEMVRVMQKPQAAGSRVQEVGMKGFFPFTKAAFTVFVLMSMALLVCSLALIVRFRWSRRAFLVLCGMYCVWILVVGSTFLLAYNRVIAEAVAGLSPLYGATPTAYAKYQEMMRQIQQRNFALTELFGSLFGLFYFGLMGYLVSRPEVKQDVERKIAKDLMDWENLPEGGKLPGGKP